MPAAPLVLALVMTVSPPATHVGFEMRDAHVREVQAAPAEPPRFEMRGRFQAIPSQPDATQAFVLIATHPPTAKAVGCGPPNPDGIFRNGFE